MTLAEKIIRYRTDNRLTQSDFAKLIGITLMTVYRIENSKPCHKITERRILDVIEKGE